jgi:hypothetical protein
MHGDGALLQRKSNCACGGGCPSCQQNDHPEMIQTKLQISTPGDQHEQEADRVAEQVMRMPESDYGRVGETKERPSALLSRLSSPRGSHSQIVPPIVHDVLSSPGQQLDASTRAFMEPRFGGDFAPVRVHTDRRAAESASSVYARAYTVGEHIVFGSGEYEPKSSVGRQLIAHELAHVLQQTGAAGPGPNGIVQRVPTLEILDEHFVGPPSATQRRAAKSCPIECCGNSLGTLNAMPLQQQQDRGAIVPARSPLATGIGAALHFIANSAQPPAGDRCHCDDFRMIQIVESNDPEDPRGNSFVDNNPRAVAPTPFYGDTGRHGRGEAPIPAGYVDAGQTVDTTESIYDRPYRTPAILAASGLTSDFSWMAETCVACIKNTEPDVILGCVTYGFTRAYNAATHSFGPVVGVDPRCLHHSTQHYRDTLSTDPTTSGIYDFRAAPGFIECNPEFFEQSPGDFPAPPPPSDSDTRVA